MKKKYYFIKMLLAGAVMYGAVTNINTVHAENEFMRPVDYMLQDENGVYCMVDGTKLTGQFSLQPNYMLGDTGLNGTVDAEDAIKMRVKIKILFFFLQCSSVRKLNVVA